MQGPKDRQESALQRAIVEVYGTQAADRDVETEETDMATHATTMETSTAYFMLNGDGTFGPTSAAGGHWGESLISGPAVAGLAARALERDYGQAGFTPARFTIDLLKPARQLPTRTQTRLIREGHRVRYAECDVIQGDWIVARATAVQYLSLIHI